MANKIKLTITCGGWQDDVGCSHVRTAIIETCGKDMFSEMKSVIEAYIGWNTKYRSPICPVCGSGALDYFVEEGKPDGQFP